MRYMISVEVMEKDILRSMQCDQILQLRKGERPLARDADD